MCIIHKSRVVYFNGSADSATLPRICTLQIKVGINAAKITKNADAWADFYSS